MRTVGVRVMAENEVPAKPVGAMAWSESIVSVTREMSASEAFS